MPSTQPGSWQLCLSLHLLLMQSLKVSQRRELWAFSGLSWVYTGPGHLWALLDSQECIGTFQSPCFPAFPVNLLVSLFASSLIECPRLQWLIHLPGSVFSNPAPAATSALGEFGVWWVRYRQALWAYLVRSTQIGQSKPPKRVLCNEAFSAPHTPPNQVHVPDCRLSSRCYLSGDGTTSMPLSSWFLPGLENLSYLSVPLIAASFRLVSHIPKTLFLTGFASFFLALLKDGLLEFLTQPFLLTSVTSLLLTWWPILSLHNYIHPTWFQKDFKIAYKGKLWKYSKLLLVIFVVCLLVGGHSSKNLAFPCCYWKLGPTDRNVVSFGDPEVFALPVTAVGPQGNRSTFTSVVSPSRDCACGLKVIHHLSV